MPDPSNPLDYNRYLYARGNPLKYNDPTGHCVASIFSSGSAASVFDAACWTMVEATSTATAVAAVPLVGAVALMGGVIAGIPLTTDDLPAYPPPITGQEQGQIIESFPLPGATTLTIDGVPLVQQAGNGIHGIQPETPPTLISTWIGSNPRGVHTRDGFERATTDLPGGLAAAEKFFEQYAGRLPNLTDNPSYLGPTDTYIDGPMKYASVRIADQVHRLLKSQTTRRRLMRESTSVHNVAFQDVLEILQQWEAGVLQFDKVQAWAEGTIENGWHEYDKDDPRSLLAEVIGMLDDMYRKPILKQDIPILRHVLHQASISPANAWDAVNNYVEATNWEHRKAQANANIHKYQSPMLDTMSDP